MENVGVKLEQLFLKAGQTHYYQYVITILFTIEFCCTHFLNYCIPYLEEFPKVVMNGSSEEILFYYGLCKNSTNYSIKQKERPNSIVDEFKIYCSKTKIYFLGLCYNIGKVIGSCLSYIFIDGIGRKKTFIIFMPIGVLLMCAFKFMKASSSFNWIYGIYVDLFLSGICNYIIVVDILIYICEIVQQTKIPYFVMAIATGTSLAGLFSAIIFEVDEALAWRDILLIFAGIHLLVYFFFLFFLIDSPILYLNKEQYEDFSLYLGKIAARNGKNLTQEDFQFLAPYINKDVRSKMFNKKSNNSDKVLITSTNNNITNENQYNNKDEGYNKIYNETLQNLTVKNEDFENNKNLNNLNNSNNNNEIKDFERRSSIFVKDSSIKDIILLSLGEDADVPVKSLFGETKMSDYTPLDLIRFSSQIKNFLILSFNWIVISMVRTGIDFRKKYMIKYIDQIKHQIINFGLDIFVPFVLLTIYYNYQYSIQKILITAQIIQFIFFSFVIFFIQKASQNSQIIFLNFGKVCCHCSYLIMYIITFEIYPIMIRTKGAGFNIGFSGIGAIIIIIVIENISFDSLILYFLIFDFFSMAIFYGLPNKIGTLILDNPKYLKTELDEDEDEDEVKFGDICIENSILVKPNKPEKKPEIKEDDKESSNSND
jgi:hypothetical protein